MLFCQYSRSVDIGNPSRTSVVPEDDPAAEKLRLEIEEIRARRALADLERRKLEFEVDDVRIRVDGTEPHWPWQRLQYVAVIGGVLLTLLSLAVTYRGFLKSVEQTRRTNIQAASEHLQRGWPSGAIELAQYGSEGLQMLVASVDATHRTVQQSWPIVTRAALREIERHGDSLTKDEKTFLGIAMKNNHRRIRELLDRPSPQENIADYICVQLDLQRVLGTKAQDWDLTAKQIQTQQLSLPDC